MTYPENMLKELDVIELRVAVDAWEAGTVATVLEVATDSELVEIANEDGRTLDVLTVPNGAAAPLDARNVPERPRTSRRVQRPIPTPPALWHRRVRAVAETPR